MPDLRQPFRLSWEEFKQKNRAHLADDRGDKYDVEMREYRKMLDRERANNVRSLRGRNLRYVVAAAGKGS